MCFDFVMSDSYLDGLRSEWRVSSFRLVHAVEAGDATLNLQNWVNVHWFCTSRITKWPSKKHEQIRHQTFNKVHITKNNVWKALRTYIYCPISLRTSNVMTQRWFSAISVWKGVWNSCRVAMSLPGCRAWRNNNSTTKYHKYLITFYTITLQIYVQSERFKDQ